MEEAAREITKLKRESRERHAVYPQSASPTNPLLPAKWGMFWQALEWIAWGLGLAAFIGSNLFLIRISPAGGLERYPGHTFITFSVCAFAALGLTLFTSISKLHLFWFLPISFAASLYVASRISARRHDRDEAVRLAGKNVGN